jgi:tripartite-type tricarboxylate transporter receptor subunit TctC
MALSRRKLLKAAFAAPAVTAMSGIGARAFAQAFPSKPLRIIVPFPAGGTTDVIARFVAQRMGETMGQPVLVENRGGAGGTIGAEAVAKSAPDGYTMLMHNITFPVASTAAALAGRLPYSIPDDFAGVSVCANVPLIITAHPSVPAKDLRELVTLLQGNRSLKYNYGSTGPGSIMHVLGEALKIDGKIDMTHIPYKGAAPLKQELLAGRIQIGGDQLSTSLAEVRKGDLIALATCSPKRIAALPNVPTVRELGYPRLEFDGWNGLFVAAKTPREIIDRLYKEAAAAVRHPEIAKRFEDIAADPWGSTPAEQDALLRRQIEQFRPIIQAMDLK